MYVVPKVRWPTLLHGLQNSAKLDWPLELRPLILPKFPVDASKVGLYWALNCF